MRVRFALWLLLLASPASAQWTRVTEVPAADVFCAFANGDTVVAGVDTGVYVSVNAGATWSPSSRLVAGVTSVQAVRVRNGRLYAGTFGQGVFVSDDRGATWQAWNQGLVGGFLDSQLDVGDFAVRGDSLYVATLGAGVYVRGLKGATQWSHFGEEFEPNQASTVPALVHGGGRLLAAGGANGAVFHRDHAAPGWTMSWLDNVGIHPNLQAFAVGWNGRAWVVGTNAGAFRSLAGQEPWGFTNLGLGSLLWGAFTTAGREFFAAFDRANAAAIERSDDDGATWQLMEQLPGVFVYQLAMSRGVLYAGRVDGLWRRSGDGLSVPPAAPRPGLAFTLASPQPVRDQVRFRFTLGRGGPATIEVFDVAGRRAAPRLAGTWPAGEHELAWDPGGLEPGIYHAVLSAEGRREAVRMVRVR